MNISHLGKIITETNGTGKHLNVRAKMTVILRVPYQVNLALQTASLTHGDKSSMVTQAIRSVDIRGVKLLDLQGEQPGTFKSTTISIEPALHRQLKKAAHRRNCSMNRLINSLLAEHLKSFIQSDLPMQVRRKRAKMDSARAGMDR